MEQFYSPGGVLRQGVWNAQTGSKKFEILTPALARYYWTQFNSGIKHIQMIVENVAERELPNGSFVVDSQRSCFIYWFENGCQVRNPLPTFQGLSFLILLYSSFLKVF